MPARSRVTVPRASEIRLDDLGRARLNIPRLGRLEALNVQCNPKDCTINNHCPKKLTDRA